MEQRQIDQAKLIGLEMARDRFDRNRKAPRLQQLFLEVTPRCNLSCIHCGSRCDEHAQVDEVSLDEWKRVIDEVRDDFGTDVFIIMTGGEPTLWDGVFELGRHVTDNGFAWGMTTNGTLIDERMARDLTDAGLKSVSISVDGLPATHDAVRRVKGSRDAAIRGVRNLAATGKLRALQVTSVMNHHTVHEMDAMFDEMADLPIDSWRLMNVEPIGSALGHSDMLVTPEDMRRILRFIHDKREQQWPVCYGCCHYFGMEYEGELRDWFYLCNAGIHVMSVMHTGDIGSCLDIERRPETIFGNIRRDRLSDVWERGFGIYRQENGMADLNERCSACPDKRYCRGDSVHSWDFDRNQPMMCMRDMLDGFRFASDAKVGIESSTLSGD